MTPEPTYAACLTPPAAGAIAVLGIAGPRAWEVIRSVFHPASKRPLPEQPAVGAVWFGHVGAGGLADEVVLTLNQIEPLPWLELHCHGGRQVIDWLMELLGEHGVTPVQWPEFLTFVEPQSADRWERLAHAATVRTAAILLDQANGALAAAVATIRDDWTAGRCDSARRRAEELLRFAPLGQHLTQPWRVAVAGPPNVGKSTLVNALAGYQRSIVAPVPGTTRDVVTTAIAIDGWPVELIDMAGLRDAAGAIESAGIERARSALRGAELILWLQDASDPASPGPESGDLPCGVRVLRVVNKCDLAPNRPAGRDELLVSALSGAGVVELCAGISRIIVPAVPPAGAAVPVSQGQVAGFRRFLAALPCRDAESIERALADLMG